MKITVSSTIKAPVDKIWDYYTQPKHITQWNFASDDWCCPYAENDLKVGGSYKARMEAKDGSFGFDFGGIYDEIAMHKTIKYHLGDGREVLTSFEAKDNETSITTTFDAESQHPLDMQKNGWQAILNNFRTYTEAH